MTEKEIKSGFRRAYNFLNENQNKDWSSIANAIPKEAKGLEAHLIAGILGYLSEEYEKNKEEIK